MQMHCVICGQPTKPRTKYPGSKYRRTCSKECQAKVYSLAMARTNRRDASARMTARNPMARPDVRAKVSTRLRAMQWKPPVRGGNGHPPTPAQQLLSCALGWPTEVAVPTRIAKGSGYPTCYKLDIANLALKIAIEVDGQSHRVLSRRAQDRKKQKFLESQDWCVLRFSNEEILSSVGTVVETVLSTISKLKTTTTTLPKES